VVVSDRFRGYLWIKRRQYCWAHLDRDFQAMIDRGGQSAEVGRLLLGHSERMFAWWHPWRSPVGARKEEKYTKGAECSLGDSALGE
jgi:transposase